MKAIWKFVIGFLIVLLIAGLAITLYLYDNAGNMAEEILRDKFIKEYNKNPTTDYLIHFKKLKVDVLDGSVNLVNVSIVPKDSLVTFKSNLEQTNTPNVYLEIHIDKISLSNFDYAPALANRKISIEKFEISNPEIHIFQYTDIPDPEPKSQDTVDLRSIFLTNFDSLLVTLVDINNAQINYFKVNLSGDTNEVFSITNLYYEINKVMAHKNSLLKAPFVEFKKDYLKSENVNVNISDKAIVKLGAVEFDSEKMEIVLHKIEYLPIPTANQYFSKLRYRKPWIKFDAKKVAISDLDIDKWIDSNVLSIGKLELDKPETDIRLNLKIPIDTNVNKPMLGEMLASIPIPFFIDSLVVTHGLIDLDFIGTKTTTHGKLSFNKMDVLARNVTNDLVILAQNRFIPIDATLQVNKTGVVETHLEIDMLSQKSETVFNIHAKNLDLRKFSSILKPIVRVEITSGKMVTLDISSTLNKDGGSGFMDAHYTNLNLLIVEKDLKKESGFFLKAASSVANGFILKNDNIPGFPHYRTGNIKFIKANEDAFFKMLWLTTLHGLEDSILGSHKKDQRNAKKEEKEQHKGKKHNSISR